MGFLSRFWCRLTFHKRAEREALGSAMGMNGPRYLYQCRRCGDYFSEKW